jgi:hypothetical protein
MMGVGYAFYRMFFVVVVFFGDFAGVCTCEKTTTKLHALFYLMFCVVLVFVEGKFSFLRGSINTKAYHSIVVVGSIPRTFFSFFSCLVKK